MDRGSSRRRRGARCGGSSTPTLLLAALLAFAATAQATQTGILYWCSTCEGGSNFPGGSPCTPRSAVRGSSRSSACHAGGSLADGQTYTFSNGTAYPSSPTNNGSSDYDIAPTGCMVSA